MDAVIREKSLRASSKLAALLGPAAGLFAQGKAQAVAFGNPHPPVAQLQLFVKQRVQPLEVLQPRLERVGGGEMQVFYLA